MSAASTPTPLQQTGDGAVEDFGASLDIAGAWSAVRARLGLVVVLPVVAGAIAIGITYAIAPTFTASTTFLPPQQQSSAATALASLGPLASLATGGQLRTPADQYASLMQSRLVADRIIDRFRLMEVYDVKLMTDARTELNQKVRIAIGKKDGLITVEVDDTTPLRASDIANRYVEELRELTSKLALTEAQQRRRFFERQLEQTRDRLNKAQQALQSSGFNPGALRAEPKAAAEGYARLKAEVTAAEVRLQAVRSSMSDATPEVQQQQSTLRALREQLARLEVSESREVGPDYVSRYRDFKYHEALFELYARQFELARVDESREGALIQVVDMAIPPERRTRPKRTLTALATTLATLVLLVAFIVLRHAPRQRA